MNKIEYFKMINKAMETYNITVNYNPADGTEIKHNFKFIDIIFDEVEAIFKIETKKTTLNNNQETFKYIQELSKAGEIIEILSGIEAV